MSGTEERVIKPPMEQITSGRVFHPDNAFLYKKWLRVFLVLCFIWIVLLVALFSYPELTFIVVELAKLPDFIVEAGSFTFSLWYWILVSGVFFFWVVYSYIYVKRIDYSLKSWKGDVSPEIYVKKGIITITQKHVPFRTVTHVRTTRGPFDRLFGIGTIQIETAAKSQTAEGGGLIALILQRLMSGGAAEENIEGVKFHEELRDFILRELRGFTSKPASGLQSKSQVPRKSIFNQGTLQAFMDIRNELRASRK
ncbi:MAG: PH domain-containing protein [Candidatus Thorarchaeota archaeon]